MKEHRFLVLDGMRGIAALAVLYMHAGFGFGAPYPVHGYLAVDFFFALSGFVVAHAYEARMKAGLCFAGFARLRLVRLYPMIFLAAVLGALAFDPGWQGGLGRLVGLDAASFLLLPLGLCLGASAFPVNVPVWSLFFELLANAAHFAGLRVRLGRQVGLWLWAACAGMTGFVAWRAGSLEAVGSAGLLSFIMGMFRAFYAYFAGVLLFRLGWHERLPRWPDFVPALALAALLAVPDCGWWYDLLCVLGLFPLLLGLGARAVRTPALRGLWYWGGALSYPVYVLHEPVLRAVYRLHGDYLAAMALAVLLAGAALRWYDAPLRRWLGPARAPAP